MEEEYIDVGNKQHAYQRTLQRFQNVSQISNHNKHLILKFVRDAALGKTVIGKAKKKIGPGRLENYIHHLTVYAKYIAKKLDAVTQEDMERFIEALETNMILSQKHKLMGRESVTIEVPLSDGYKVDIKVSVKKFYKWLWGNNRTCPSIVEWIDTYHTIKEIPALTEAEVEHLVDRGRTPLQRALIQILFDSGFRIGELLNVRLHHVRLKSFDENDPSKKCFFVRTPFSKTMPRTVALPMHATTKLLSIWLEDHPVHPRLRDDGTIEAEDVRAQLFPMSAGAVRSLLGKYGKHILGKHVSPQLMRHTSATYWSNKLPYFKLCKRFGWTMTSMMPQRYIDREGIDDMEVAKIYHDDTTAKLIREKDQLLTELSEIRARRGQISQ